MPHTQGKGWYAIVYRPSQHLEHLVPPRQIEQSPERFTANISIKLTIRIAFLQAARASLTDQRYIGAAQSNGPANAATDTLKTMLHRLCRCMSAGISINSPLAAMVVFFADEGLSTASTWFVKNVSR